MFVSDLERVKLKKTTTKDSSGPKLTGFVSQEKIDEYAKSVIDANIEGWIDAIRPFTFLTYFHPLLRKHAELFISVYELKVTKKQPSLPQSLVDELSALERELDQTINQVRGTKDSVFVKSSCRSPKDTTIHNSVLLQEYARGLAATKPDEIIDDNFRLTLLIKASVEALKTKSASQVLESFTTSERIYQDMKLMIDTNTSSSPPSPNDQIMNFVIREWVDIDPDMEFRGFVVNGKLNALSQYNHVIYFPRLIHMKKTIETSVLNFFYQTVAPNLSRFDRYVVDFALVKTNEDVYDQVYVIELNPFLSSTDAALFSWQTELVLLENGPFEFRLRESKLPNLKSLISIDWRDILSRSEFQ